MAVPEAPKFESFLRSCQLSYEADAENAIRFAPQADTLSTTPLKTIWLHYSSEALSLESALAIVENSLRSEGFSADDSIARAFMGLAIATRGEGESAIDHLNDLLARAVDAQLTQVVVLNQRVDDADYSIEAGEFRLKRFDPSKLLYWAKRGGSGYPIDLNAFTSHVCLERAPFLTRVIPWPTLHRESAVLTKRWGRDVTLALLIDEYFQSVFRNHYDEIAGRLREQMMVVEAGSLFAVNERSLLSSMFTRTIGLFSWRSDPAPKTWALLLSKSGLRLNLPPAENLAASRDWLRSELGFEGFSAEKPIDRAIESYCDFLQRAQRHLEQRAINEAFLHFVIALDLFLGLEQSVTRGVAERGALLVHRQVGETFENQLKCFRRLYNLRSKFVHEGLSVRPGDVRELDAICRELLWTLLSVSGAGRFQNVDDFLRQVDYLVSALRAAREVSDDEFAGVGVPTVPGRRDPPTRLERLREDGLEPIG